MRAAEWLHRPRRHLDRPAGPPNPFESFLLGVCVVQGAAAVIGFSQPAAFEGSFPPWVHRAWGVILLLGGVAAVVGLYWPGDPVDGVLIKRVGLVALAGVTIAYGIAGLATPTRLFVGATFNLAFGIACIIRIRQVTAAISALRRQLRGLREEWKNGGPS
jgi:predicted MFS family arabinose efflux permease